MNAKKYKIISLMFVIISLYLLCSAIYDGYNTSKRVYNLPIEKIYVPADIKAYNLFFHVDSFSKDDKTVGIRRLLFLGMEKLEHLNKIETDKFKIKTDENDNNGKLLIFDEINHKPVFYDNIKNTEIHLEKSIYTCYLVGEWFSGYFEVKYE